MFKWKTPHSLRSLKNLHRVQIRNSNNFLLPRAIFLLLYYHYRYFLLLLFHSSNTFHSYVDNERLYPPFAYSRTFVTFSFYIKKKKKSWNEHKVRNWCYLGRWSEKRRMCFDISKYCKVKNRNPNAIHTNTLRMLLDRWWY